MIQGYSTLGAVALRLIEDNNAFGLKQCTKYSLEQAIELVCHRHKTLGAMDGSPSYVWWWFTMEEGEVQIHFEQTKLASIPLDKKRRQWRMVAVRDLEPDKLIEEFIRDDYWKYNDFLSRYEEAMLRMGVQVGQRCLTRYREEWSVDYFGEGDCDYDIELLYVEPMGNCATVYLPIPLGDLGVAPKMKQLHYA